MPKKSRLLITLAGVALGFLGTFCCITTTHLQGEESDETSVLHLSNTETETPSGTQKRKGALSIGNASSASRTKHRSGATPRQKQFDPAAEQNAFLNDLLNDDPVPSAEQGNPESRRANRNKSLRQKKAPLATQQTTRSVSPESAVTDLKPKNRLSSADPARERSISNESSHRGAPNESLIPLVSLPLGESLSPQVNFNWVVDGPITVSQPTNCRLVVHNAGQVIAQQVSLEIRLGETVQLLGTQPELSSPENQLLWNLGDLPAGAEQTLEIKLIPKQPGELPVAAILKLGSGSVTKLVVEEPLLVVQITGEQTILSGDSWRGDVTLLNPGTGTVKGATITADLPEGVTHEGNSQISLVVGDISPGESRKVSLPLVCQGKGQRLLSLTAQGNGIEPKVSELEWTVLAPELQIEATGPARRFVSRPALYDIKLANQGDSSAENVKVVCVVPAGFALKEVGQGGVHNPQNNTVSWTVSQIPAGETQQLSLETVAQSSGEQVFLVSARSDHGGNASTSCETRVDGISSVKMSVRDLDDPIELGVETGYEVVLTNDGTQSLHAVQVNCELPSELEFLSGSGPTEITAAKGQVHLSEIGELAPGQEVTYQLKFRGVKEGSFRMRAKLTTPDISKPFLAEELTRIYED